VQFTVRLPRVVATSFAIVVAAVAVAAWLPANAESQGAIIKVCVDPTTQDLTLAASCTGQTITWNQDGAPGANGANGATGATGPAGPVGPAGPPVHLAKTRPALTAKLEAAIEVQQSTITDVNRQMRASLATVLKLPPSTDPTTAAVQAAVNVHGTSIARLVNVLRALARAQDHLLLGLE
jgi:hypothetical protein